MSGQNWGNSDKVNRTELTVRFTFYLNGEFEGKEILLEERLSKKVEVSD